LLVILAVGCAPPRGGYHTIQKGQTLYQIARTYQVDPDRLARINRIGDPTRLAIGDRLFIPGATRTLAVRSTVSAAKSTAPKPTARATPPPAKPMKPSASLKPAPARPVKKEVPKQQPYKSGGKPPGAQKGLFQWPVKGKVIKSYGSRPYSATGKGIEIAVRAKSKVKSAAAGKVIYSGNGIPGYGNLIIVQHGDSLYSVYGFNQKNLVAAGTFVSQGQEIALSGIPPSGGVPRLYFEARVGKNPVNPIFYLP